MISKIRILYLKMTKLKMKPTRNQVVKLMAVAGGMFPVAPMRMGMLMYKIHFCFGNALCNNHTGTGASAPTTKNQLTDLYSPREPNIRFGPISPQMTDAS